MRAMTILATIVALMTTAGASQAQTARFASEYTISAFGFRIAGTRFDTIIEDNTYQVSGTLRTTGLVRLFSTTNGEVQATGAFSSDAIKPRNFSVRYTDSGEEQVARIRFNGSEVAEVFNDPEVKRKDDWIEVPPGELTGALDPIAASLLPAASPRDVCNYTIRVFDGAMRSNIEMEFLRTVPFSATGFKGDAITCSARFVPIGGYPERKQEISIVRDSGRIEVSWAPVGTTGLYAPVRGTVKVPGTEVRFTATRFEQLTN